MRNKVVRRLAMGMAAVLTAGALLAGCGSTEEGSTQNTAETTETESTEETDSASSDSAAAADDTEEAEDTAAVTAEDIGTVEISWLLDMGPENSIYPEYEDSPAVKYWQNMTWTTADGTMTGTVDVDFMTPPAGAEQDNFNTLLATGEYPEVMAMAYASENTQSLYEQGIAIDLTEYVEKYMPNYMAWMEENPSYAAQMRNDGKILMLYTVCDGPKDAWAGFMYRRDWIVKYGKDADGNSFEGGYVDEEKETWEDNVVFPSGNTDPLYISDWEWMFEIFEKALEEEGIEDGYASAEEEPKKHVISVNRV